MPLIDCDPPATPTPVLANTDLIDRLSLLRHNLIRFSRFTYAGSAYGENPHTDPPVDDAYGNQKKAIILPGGDADVEAQLLDRDYGAATIGHNGGAYSISFYAYLRGGGTSGTVYAGFRDVNGDPIDPTSFPADVDPDIVDAADDVSFAVTDTPTLFTWEHIASDEEGFWDDLPGTAQFKFFVSGSSDLPAGSELVITEFQMQNDNYYAPWDIDLPWRPARGEEDLAQYTEYILNTNFTELANRRHQRVTSNLEGQGLLLETNGPVRIIRVPEDVYYLDDAADGTLVITTGTDPDVVQQIIIPNRDQATIRTRSKLQVLQEGASLYEIVPGPDVTAIPPIGGSLRSVGRGTVMDLTKRSSSDIWSVTASTAVSGITYIAFEAGEFGTTITAAKLDSRRMPTPFTIIDARVNVDTAQATGSILTFDFKDGAGVSIFSTLPTIDNTEETTTTAATPLVLSTTSLADDEKVTFHCTQVGDGTAKGARGWLIGFASNLPATGGAVNIAGSLLTSGTNTETISGLSTSSQITFSKPLASASGGALLYDAFSGWPDDSGTVPVPSPVPGQTWNNTLSIYGNNGGGDVLLWSATLDANHYATESAAYSALAAQLPQSFSGYATYKVTGHNDGNPGDNRGGLSLRYVIV